MKFSNEDFKITFEVPDKPTVRQVLAYDSAVELRMEQPTYERLWAGVCSGFVTSWQSEDIPQPTLSVLDEVADDEHGQRVLAIVKWASLAVFSFVLDLRNISKN